MTATAKGVTDPVLTDEEFEEFDTDHDGVVHLTEVELLPPPVEPAGRETGGGKPQLKGKYQ